MATINITETPINKVNFRELECFIAEFYSCCFEICEAMDFPNNDTNHLYRVTPNLCDVESLEIQLWLDGLGGQPSLRDLLNDLCREGVLEPGEYLVSVCW